MAPSRQVLDAGLVVTLPTAVFAVDLAEGFMFFLGYDTSNRIFHDVAGLIRLRANQAVNQTFSCEYMVVAKAAI